MPGLIDDALGGPPTPPVHAAPGLTLPPATVPARRSAPGVAKPARFDPKNPVVAGLPARLRAQQYQQFQHPNETWMDWLSGPRRLGQGLITGKGRALSPVEEQNALRR